MDRYLFETLLSSLLDLYQEVELLNHGNVMCLNVLRNMALLSIMAVPSLVLTESVRAQVLDILTNIFFFSFFALVIQKECKVYVIVGFISTSLMISDVEQFFMCSLAI